MGPAGILLVDGQALEDLRSLFEIQAPIADRGLALERIVTDLHPAFIVYT